MLTRRLGLDQGLNRTLSSATRTCLKARPVDPSIKGSSFKGSNSRSLHVPWHLKNPSSISASGCSRSHGPSQEATRDLTAPSKGIARTGNQDLSPSARSAPLHLRVRPITGHHLIPATSEGGNPVLHTKKQILPRGVTTKQPNPRA